MGSLLDGKVVLVTGAGRGIGEAYARLAAAEGARVVVNDIDAEPARSVAESIAAAGQTAVAHVGDVSEWDQAGAVVQLAVERFGRLDGLVNNAGIFFMGRSAEETEERFRRIVATNVFGVTWTGIHALRQMLSQGNGSIVNVTSGAHAGMEGMSAYGATKGAVASLTYAWAVDMAGTGVRVNAISPLAGTRMLAEVDAFNDVPANQRGQARERSPRPEANAAAVIYLLSGAASQVRGQVVRVDGPNLSIMSHPLNLLPNVPGGAVSVDAVQSGFTATLNELLQQTGLHDGQVKSA